MKSGAQQDIHAARRRRWVRAQRANLSDWGLILRLGCGLLRTGLPLVLGAAWIFAVLVRLGAQDNAPPLLTFYYYATPPPVLVALAALLAALLLLARRRRMALAAAGAMLACGVWTWTTLGFRHAPPTAAGTPLRVLFWNVNWGHAGWDALLAALRAYDADIVALVEACDSFELEGLSDTAIYQRRAAETAAMRALWQTRLPEYAAFQHESGIALLVRGRFAETPQAVALTPGVLFSYGHSVQAEVVTPAGRVLVVVVDVIGTLGLTRAWPLHDLAEAIAPLKDRPLLLVGDMNTPLDSPQFRPLRGHLANAFEIAGNGYAATWPLPVPVLALDQAWTSARVQVLRCEAGWSRLSDHRPLLLEITVPQTQ